VDFVPVSQEVCRRFSLTDAEVEQLARHALVIEAHYGRPMDIEWGKDGVDGELYILQDRPETVVFRRASGTVSRYTLVERSAILVEGRAIGQRIGAGQVRDLTSIHQMTSFQAGDVLVVNMTDPDWEPINRQGHGPWRTHLTRGDHCPRTWHSRRRRYRKPFPRPWRRHPGHRVLRRRRGRLCVRGNPRLHAAGDQSVHHAAGTGHNHDERGHPRAGLQLLPASEPRRGPRVCLLIAVAR